jgi:exosortase A-associated hydrolase 2
MTLPLELAYIESGGLRLHALLRGVGSQALVMCDPFAEEKKCAQRVMSEVAWSLAKVGWAVLRFDYRGCGDSEGDFEHFALGHWQEDIIRAVEWVRQRLRPTRWALLGVRLGATLAAQLAEGTLAPDQLILIAPILDGRQYWRENFRRQLIKVKLTAGEEASAEDLRRAAEEEFFDLGGWLVTRALRNQLEALSLVPPAFQPSYPGPCLVIDISARHEPAAPLVSLAQAYARGRVEVVRMEPFWQRLGLIDATPLIAKLQACLA